MRTARYYLVQTINDKGTDVNEQFWKIELPQRLQSKTAFPKYRLLADSVAAAIAAGQLAHDEQLPTVRDLAGQLGVSGTTVAAAYRTLAEQKLVIGKVGSGTRISGMAKPVQLGSVPVAKIYEDYPSKVPLWRRRTQTNHIASLARAFPEARNYASGTPNPDLLPLAALKQAWLRATTEVTAKDLQYAGPAPLALLRDALLRRLERDSVPAAAADLLMGSSAQQLMTLALQIAGELRQNTNLLVGVEEPGYPTLFDSYERMGSRLTGMSVDAEGAVPAAVEAALNRGVDVLVFTPRAHNPTGVSWSPRRLAQLAEVIAAYPDVLVVEDDQFAEAANTAAGSLLGDPRLENRVVYIRSFSKVIAPDLRLALAVARPQLRSLLTEAKFYTDGWSSSFSQRALAHVLSDPDTDVAIGNARVAYNRRRARFVSTLSALDKSSILGLMPAADGVNVWLELKNGISAADVAERAAAAGIIFATGEPFFVRAGRDDALRVNTGMLAEDKIPAVSQALIKALSESASSTPALFLQHSL